MRLIRIPKQTPRGGSVRTSRRGGMTLMEIALAMPIIMLALGMFTQMLTAGKGLRQSSRENWLASLRAQDVLETMRNQPFRDLVALYNEDPLDDPGGPGTAPGIHFDVDELFPQTEDADGFVGLITIPTFNAGTDVAPDWQLREDVDIPVLGMPRDLNGDNIVGDQDRTDDFTILPVEVEIRWQSRFGPRSVRIHTLFSEL